MKFCGPTIVYALMQAVGMYNDHVTTCFRHAQLTGAGASSAASTSGLAPPAASATAASGKTGRQS